MSIQIKDLPVGNKTQIDQKNALSARAKNVGLDDNATSEQVKAAEKKSKQ